MVLWRTRTSTVDGSLPVPLGETNPDGATSERLALRGLDGMGRTAHARENGRLHSSLLRCGTALGFAVPLLVLPMYLRSLVQSRGGYTPMRSILTPRAVIIGLTLILAACSGSSGGSSYPTGPGGSTTPALSGGNGSYVLWTQTADVLPLAVWDATDSLGSITQAAGVAPACGASGAFTIPAPLTGQRDLTVVNLPKFGNAVVHLTPAS